MNNADIRYVLPSLELVKLLYDYDLLDRVIRCDTEKLGEDMLCEYYYFILDTLNYAIWNEDVDGWDAYKYYYSNEIMTEYYALCRTYCCRHGIKFKNNPFVKLADEAVCSFMNLETHGYEWMLLTKSNHKWGSGILFIEYYDFRGAYALLEALILMHDWFTTGVARLKRVLEKEERHKSEVLAA